MRRTEEATRQAWLFIQCRYFGDDVRVIGWKKNEIRARQTEENEANNGGDGNIKDFKEGILECGHNISDSFNMGTPCPSLSVK